MQLTNFLRDVGEDLQRGRVYLPTEDMEKFRVSEDDLRGARLTDDFIELMKFQIARARGLYEAADPGIPLLPPVAQKPVRMARILYSRILDRIEARNYDVFSGRARTSKIEKLQVAARVLMNLA
ncbi:MAG: phytoene/squalene synthase family protein, partial [Fimbriimonas sp.]